MSLPSATPTRGQPVLKFAFYLLAGLVLVLGLIGGIILLSSARLMVANFLLPFQLMGIGQISDSFAPLLTGLFINLGIVAILVSLILSALLYTAGRLLGRIADLEARLAHLEAAQVAAY